MEKSENFLSDNPLVGDVIELLQELLHAVLAASVPAWVHLQLTLPQLRTLFIIAHHKTSSVVQISKHLGVGEPTASHQIDILVRSGLVDRSEDPADRRRAIIRLSTGGEELIQKLLGWEDFLGSLLYKIPDQDLTFFRHGLVAVMKEINGQAENDENDQDKTAA